MHAITMCSTCQAAAWSEVRRVKYAVARHRSRAGMIVLIAGVALVFGPAGHSASLNEPPRPGTLLESSLLHGQRIPVAVDHNASRQYHVLDKELRTLYDEIMGRGEGR